MNNILLDNISFYDLDFGLRFVMKVFLEFVAPDFSDKGIGTFYQLLVENNNFRNKLELTGAFIDDELVGVIATSNNSTHIDLLFVDGNYQNKGIAKKLLNDAIIKCKSNEITLNAFIKTEEIFYKMGFEKSSVKMNYKGIIYTPMVYKIKK